MTLGPLEYTVIGFEGNNFDGSIAREIGKVVENGTIALVDVVLVGSDDDGQPVILELDNKDDPRFAGFHSLVDRNDGPVHGGGPARDRRVAAGQYLGL